MQDAITQSERDSLHSSGDLPPISREPTGPRGLERAEQDQPTETLKGEPPVTGTPSPFQRSGLRAQRHTFLPQWGLYYAAIADVIAGVLAALLTMVRIPQNINEHIAQFTRRQARRFDGAARSGDGKDKKAVAQPSGKASKAPRSPFTPTHSASVKPVRLDPPTTFADIAGIDEVRVELEEIAQFLRSPEKFDRLGARIPRGALLVGPPGTGKTLLARGRWRSWSAVLQCQRLRICRDVCGCGRQPGARSVQPGPPGGSGCHLY
jgi:hypothetical protein